MNSYSTSWWSLLLINRPREDERLSWPCWLTYSGRFTHINGYPSAAGAVQTSESSPVSDRSTFYPCTEPPNQLSSGSVRTSILYVCNTFTVYTITRKILERSALFFVGIFGTLGQHEFAFWVLWGVRQTNRATANWATNVGRLDMFWSNGRQSHNNGSRTETIPK